MQLRQLYTAFLQSLEQIYSKGEARAITDLVFISIAGIKKSDLIKDAALELEGQLLKKINIVLNELQSGKPVQYVLGYTHFCNYLFKVGAGVLIPRPETEELVHLLLNECKDKSALRILDVGTGSGCIAISIKKAMPDFEVHAVDRCDIALAIAKENSLTLGADIQWHHVDFLDEKNTHALPAFDIIVSNPPYIPLSEKENLEKNVRDFEPEIALFVPDRNPLLFYEAIAQFGRKHLNKEGKIWVEIHEAYGEQTKQLFTSIGYDARLLKDVEGKNRFIRAVNHFH